MLQRLQAREGFLGHRLDLVSKQSSAVSRWEDSERVRKRKKRECTISEVETDKRGGLWDWKSELCRD